MRIEQLFVALKRSLPDPLFLPPRRAGRDPFFYPFAYGFFRRVNMLASVARAEQFAQFLPCIAHRAAHGFRKSLAVHPIAQAKGIFSALQNRTLTMTAPILHDLSSGIWAAPYRTLCETRIFGLPPLAISRCSPT